MNFDIDDDHNIDAGDHFLNLRDVKLISRGLGNQQQGNGQPVQVPALILGGVGFQAPFFFGTVEEREGVRQELVNRHMALRNNTINFYMKDRSKWIARREKNNDKDSLPNSLTEEASSASSLVIAPQEEPRESELDAAIAATLDLADLSKEVANG